MKDAVTAPEVADPYATLETILKVIGRTWLSEEWRLEDVRLLAQEAITARGRTATASLPSRIRSRSSTRAQASANQDERMSS